MNLFEIEIDEKSRVGSEFMARVANEIRRAAAIEKSSRKLTQQAIAEKIETSRAVVNREMQGLENLSARRIAELLWAMGWEPFFEARKPPEGDNMGHERGISAAQSPIVTLEYKSTSELPRPLENRTSTSSNATIGVPG